MRPLRTRLEEVRPELGIAWETLERDYVLSWVLAGISRVDALREGLVFKGRCKRCTGPFGPESGEALRPLWE